MPTRRLALSPPSMGVAPITAHQSDDDNDWQLVSDDSDYASVISLPLSVDEDEDFREFIAASQSSSPTDNANLVRASNPEEPARDAPRHHDHNGAQGQKQAREEVVRAMADTVRVFTSQGFAQGATHCSYYGYVQDQSQSVEHYGMDTTDVVPPDQPPTSNTAGNTHTDLDNIITNVPSILRVLDAIQTRLTSPDHRTPFSDQFLSKCASFEPRLRRLGSILEESRRPGNRTLRHVWPATYDSTVKWLVRLERDLLNARIYFATTITAAQSEHIIRLSIYARQLDRIIQIFEVNSENYSPLCAGWPQIPDLHRFPDELDYIDPSAFRPIRRRIPELDD